MKKATAKLFAPRRPFVLVARHSRLVACLGLAWLISLSTTRAQAQAADGALEPLPPPGPSYRAAAPQSESAPPRNEAPPPPPSAPPPPMYGPRGGGYDDGPPVYYVPRRFAPRSEWGLNLHGGGLIGPGRERNAAMGLVGVGLRYRPIPQAAVEGVFDFAEGHDANGYQRREVAITLNGLIFLNPRNRLQVYVLGGLGWSGAHAVDDREGLDRVTFDYGYLGIQGGGGLELRLTRMLALNADFVGFLRGRIDEGSRYDPEFVDNDGRATNSSGGALLRGGLTLYW